MRVAFCCAEVYPFAKTGGLGDVCGALPLALEKIGTKVDVFMPGYRCIDRNRFAIKKISNSLSHTQIGQGINVYFLESKKYFDRDGLYGHALGDYKDNLERFRFFNVKTLEALKELGHQVDIVHCHDWHTSLIPVYLKMNYGRDPFFAKTRSLLTIHNLAFQGLFAKEEFPKLGLPQKLFNKDAFEFYRKLNFFKAGIAFSDRINAVSPQYAKEIQTKRLGCGLDPLIKKNRKKLSGILNGIDYAIWNPKHDLHIVQRYSVGSYKAAKEKNKTFLQKILGLPVRKEVPLFSSVGRLSHQKGIDLIIETIPELMKEDVQLVIVGIGERHYERRLQELVGRYKGKLAVRIEFEEKLAHQIYAGSDVFLMPSNFEPCGLSQMIALKYGAVPLVYRTGGLANTVKSCDKSPKGNGIVFEKYTAKEFLRAQARALRLYKDKERLAKVVNNGLISHFSWEESAIIYKNLYQCLSSD